MSKGILIEVDKALNGHNLGARIAAGHSHFHTTQPGPSSAAFEGWHKLATEAFNEVASKKNWKLPIDKIVSEIEPERAGFIAAAVGFFTGDPADVAAVGPSTFRFRAPGYYATVGA